MIVNYTPEEQAKLEALTSKYEALIAEAEKEVERLRSDALDPDGSIEAAINAKRLPEPIELRPEPTRRDSNNKPIYTIGELEAYYATPEYQAYKKANDAANEEMRRMFDEWESKGSEAWKAARKKHLELLEEYNQKWELLLSQCEKRQFAELKGDPDKIMQDAKSQMELYIERLYQHYTDEQLEGRIFSAHDLRVEGETLYLDPEELIKDSKKLLRLHFDFFSGDQESTRAIQAIVLDVIVNSPYASSKKGVLRAYVNKVLEPGAKPQKATKKGDSINTNAPKHWLTPVDKVSGLAFKGALQDEENAGNPEYIGVSIGNKKSKKEIKTLVSLDYADEAIKIISKRELTAYDREVHDALVTLYVDGENEYITPQMIYRAMTGNPGAKLVTKQQEAISDSLNKLLYSRLRLKASPEECKAYGFDEFSYEGTVIQGEKVTATIKGVSIIEVYHLLKEPVLYTYAGKKNQIGRLDIKLLDTPVNKNEETLTLQGYLTRRILAMKSNKQLSRIILYDTLFKELEITAASDGALRKKKLKVRNTIKTILDYWKNTTLEDGTTFITGYTENNKHNEIVSVTIRL